MSDHAPGPLRLTLKVRNTLAKAITASGHYVPASMARAKSFNAVTSEARHGQDELHWHPNLTGNEKNALHHYTEKHHLGPDLNNMHRWGELRKGDDFTPLVAKHADAALGKARIKEKHGIIVHRGIGGAFAHRMAQAHHAAQAGQGEGIVGSKFQEKGYLSTSTVPVVAHHFAHSNIDPENAVTIHHMIHVKQGVKMGSVKAMSRAPHEHEMLGERGLTMHHVAFTEHDASPEAHEIVRRHAAATGRTVGTGPGQVPPPRHYVMHSVIEPKPKASGSTMSAGEPHAQA